MVKMIIKYLIIFIIYYINKMKLFRLDKLVYKLFAYLLINLINSLFKIILIYCL